MRSQFLPTGALVSPAEAPEERRRTATATARRTFTTASAQVIGRHAARPNPAAMRSGSTQCWAAALEAYPRLPVANRLPSQASREDNRSQQEGSAPIGSTRKHVDP